MRPKRFAVSQHGVGLIEALVAMLVLSFGLLGLAALYVRSAPAPYQNQSTTSAQSVADSFMSTLASDPNALPMAVASATSASAMPDAATQGWFAQSALSLPGLSVTVVSGPVAAAGPSSGASAPCSPQACSVNLTLSWTQLAAQRTQVFHGQIGIR